MLLLVIALGIYQPELWQVYPSMDEIRCISASSNRLFVAVPRGVYILNRFDYSYVRCLTRADGIEDEVELCAWNPVRSNLLILAAGRLYEYSDVSDRASELSPPFSGIRSIGIAADGAYFDTDKGLFRKHRVAPEFFPVQTLPRTITWYGERDTAQPQDYVVLNPYFVTDEYLNQYQLSRVRADPVRRKLLVWAEGYGLLIYSLTTGAQEAHIRLGPLARAESFIRLDGRLWFFRPDQSAALDQSGNWNRFLTRPGDPPQTASLLLSGRVTDLARRERLLAVLPDAQDMTESSDDSGRVLSRTDSLPPSVPRSLLLGTDYGLYRLDDKGSLTTLLKLNRPVYALARLEDSVLVGTDLGLFLLAGDSLLDVADPFGRSDWGVYDIAQGAAGLFL
ncbi:hypothetical protein FJY69_10370, partial [candidate division WOR-3 bacterium]|nr:hypothetical protein [candidate division WOR-3 bacterium]